MKEYIKLLKEIGKFPELKNLVISKIFKEEPNFSIHIKGTWNFKNYSTSETNPLTSSYIYDTKNKKALSLHSVVPDKRIILTSISPCFKKVASLYQDESCCFINIISNENEVTSINLKDKELHGKVYKDEQLSSFCWSPDSTKLALVAEKMRPKNKNFLSMSSDHEGKGEEYVYIDDWGEQMEGQHQSVIVVVNTASEELKVWDLPPGFCGGQVVWSPEAKLVGVAFATKPFRLGLIYCMNRDSVLFQMDSDTGSVSILTEGNNQVRSPRFSPDGSKLAFLQSPVLGPHIDSARLCLMDWKDKKTTVLVDYVDKEMKIEDGTSFYGLDGSSLLPLRCWSEDSQSLVFSSLNPFSIGTYVINSETKELCRVPLEGSLPAHDVKEDFILASVSSLTDAPRIALIPFASHASIGHSFGDVIFLNDVKRVDGIPKEWQQQWSFVNSTPHPQPGVSDLPVPVIYFGPTQAEAGSAKRPLIVWPHGGPHSMIRNEFIASASFFVRLGFSVVFPNFRGSLGQGKRALQSLPGNCGTSDVDDVYQATLQCLDRFDSLLDRSRVVLFGGSHGGFLVAHLSAKHPDLYKAVVARNPVIDLISMASSSDIPDWVAVESGETYSFGKSYDGEMLSKMLRMSPIGFVDQVKAPTLLLLGKEDRRVPQTQGLHYYKMLLARGIVTKTFVYNDCHPLGKVDVNAHVLTQSALWFKQHS